MKPRAFLVVFLLASAAGLLFSGLSTYDFIQHLDRQLHGIHCSFIPGLGGLDATGSDLGTLGTWIIPSPPHPTAG